MNASMWWFYCETEDDVKFYRRHIIKKPEVVDWIREQQGAHYDDHDVDREPAKELNTDILGPLLANLSELDQTILRLHYVDMLKWREISEKLGYNLSYLWKREKRAMEKLRAIIDRDGLSPWRNDEEEND
jgi:DNA-directed RNA polymerase specialized sigma24 family protein